MDAAGRSLVEAAGQLQLRPPPGWAQCAGDRAAVSALQPGRRGNEDYPRGDVCERGDGGHEGAQVLITNGCEFPIPDELLFWLWTTPGCCWCGNPFQCTGCGRSALAVGLAV
jgi:hypothetical protein